MMTSDKEVTSLSNANKREADWRLESASEH